MKIVSTDKTQFKNSLVIKNIDVAGHEKVVYCEDKSTGLKAIIAIHDTTLGPALGGTRMWNYSSQKEALNDVLRLSRGMTYKAAISGLKLGGGKAVIIGDSKTKKNKALMCKFGQFVESLKGKYITAEDVGMSTNDMKYVRSQTKHVTGIPENMGGSGDPSPVTAYGVYMGMKASAKFKWGSDKLKNRKVLIQGIGHVGEHLLKYISEEGAFVIINDINKERLKELAYKYNASTAIGDEIYDLDIDIYAPCALGATVNPGTISRLKCEIIAGAANNQLADEQRDGQLCLDKGICYAPDFLINAGGLINVYSEINGYNRDDSLRQTTEIYNTTLEILLKAEKEGTTTHNAALKIAKQRISHIVNN